MSALKLTKNELRIQQMRLTQLAVICRLCSSKRRFCNTRSIMRQLEIACSEGRVCRASVESRDFSSLFIGKSEQSISYLPKCSMSRKHMRTLPGSKFPYLKESFFQGARIFSFRYAGLDRSGGRAIPRHGDCAARKNQRCARKDARFGKRASRSFHPRQSL